MTTTLELPTTQHESEAARHAANLARWLGKAPANSHVHQLTTEATAAASYEDALAEIPDIADWGEKNYWIPPDAGRKKSLIKLLPHQRVILHLFFAQAVAEYFGVSSFQTIVFSTIKKSGKTAIAGMVARWIAETWGAFGEVYSMANDLEQARGRIYAASLASIMLDPRYNKQARGIPDVWRIIERQATYLPNNSTLRAVSADYKGEAGSNPVATLWSELWGYSSESSLRLWEELTPVPTRPRSIRYIETYAGYEGESSILNDLEDRIKKEGRRLELDELRVLLEGTDLEWPEQWLGQDLPFFVHPITRTIAYWDEGTEARRMPWQSNEYYMAQAGTLRPQAFKRLHLNHRSSNVEDFIPPEWWDRLYDANLREVSHDEPLVVGADASVTGDCTGLVAVSRHPSQRDQIATRKVAIWEPKGGKALNYRLTIEPALRLWCTGHIHPLSESCNNHAMIDLLGPCIPQKKYNVVQIAYDPYQLHDLMTRLTTDSVAWCRPFSQQGARLMADKQLYDLIKDERIHHDNHPQLGEHIKNCAAKYPPDDNTRLRLIKKAPKAKIDLAVCTSMASAEALRLSI